MLPTLPGWARELMRCGEQPPTHLLDRVRRLGESARPALLALVRIASAADDDDPDDAWAPVHAVRLLASLGPDAESIQALIDVLKEPNLDWLTNEAFTTLAGWGPVVAPPILDVIDTAGPDARSHLADVLAYCGARSDRIFAVLVSSPPGDPGSPGRLAKYGDRAALPTIRARLEAVAIDESGTLLANQEIIELADAIERLGSELTPAEREKLERVERRRRRRAREMWESLTSGNATPGAGRMALHGLSDRPGFGRTLPLTRPR